MNEMPWFRFYHEFASDPVIKMLDFGDQRHYVFVLCMKARGDLDRKYSSPELRTRAIAGFLGVSFSTLDEIRRRLLEVFLIDDDFQPCGWEKRQMRSDSSVERVRKFRQKARGALAADHQADDVTVVKRYSNGIEEEEDTEKERDIPPPAARGTPQGANDAGKPKAGRKGRGSATATRLPVDYELTPERRAIAAAEGLDPDRTFAKFADFWRSASGARARKCDWDATWRNWCRDEHDRGKQPARGRPPAVVAKSQDEIDRDLRKLAKEAGIRQASNEPEIAFLSRVERWNQERIARLSA